MSIKKIILYIVAFCLVIYISVNTCSDCSNEWKGSNVETLISEGKLSEAEEELSDISKFTTRRYYGAQLLKEYIKIGEIDKALDLWDNKLAGSRNDSDYDSKYREILYKKLIELDRDEEAWLYAPYNSIFGKDHYYNASVRYVYMVDVVMHYCRKGNKDKAFSFLRKNMIWFDKYVDNSTNITKSGDTYAEFNSNIVRAKLSNIIDEY